jgi:hypothetical protein
MPNYANKIKKSLKKNKLTKKEQDVLKKRRKPKVAVPKKSYFKKTMK